MDAAAAHLAFFDLVNSLNPHDEGMLPVSRGSTTVTVATVRLPVFFP